jgi:transcriptional regulator with XRE-family HTH domain
MIGTQRTTIAAWEQGRQRPQERFMSRLASALGVDWSVLASLRPESGAAVLRIASRDTALDPGEAPLEPVAQAPTAAEHRLADRFAECLLDGLSNGHATDPRWLAAAHATARLLGVPWSPTEQPDP